MTLLYLFLVILLIFVFYIYFVSNSNYWKLRNVPYENPPFFGNFLSLILGKVSLGKYIEKMYKRFDGPYFGFTMLNKPYFVLQDPILIKRVLIKDFRTFPNRFFARNFQADPAMCNSLLALKGTQWKKLRSTLSPVFTSGKLKAAIQLLNECGKHLQVYLEENSFKGMDAKEIATKFTVDVIASYFFGISSNCFENENSKFREAGKRLSDSSFKRTFSIISYSFAPRLVDTFKLKFFHSEATRFLQGVLLAVLKVRETSGIIRNDFINSLINIKNNNVNDIKSNDLFIAQAVTFFFAGYETTASTIAFTLHELCINEEIQNRLRREIFQVTENHGGITYEAVQAMKYLDTVVLETLRKHTVSPFVQRECVEDYKIPETGLTIERGTAILIPLHGLHNDPKHFPNPDKFDPERFVEENKHMRNLDAYLPLGAGPRNCIGKQLGLLVTKLGIIHVISKFKVERNSHTQEPLVYHPTHHLRTKKGIQVTFSNL